MKNLLFALMLVAVPVTAAADAVEWWESKPAIESLPQLIQAGYKVVGFSTAFEQNMVMDLKVNRYILQKDATIYLCVEKMQATGGATILTNCYGMRK